ncbi:MAG: FGGY-family carbohydrate kinase [Candidatus Bathyarchaeia archaeon]
MKGKYILAHDTGTTSNKAVLVGLNGEIVGHTSAEYPVYYPKKGCAEQHPQDWWNAVTKTTRELLDKAKVKPSEVAAIIFTTQMSGTLPVDSNGEPLMPCMIWLDTRAKEQAEKMSKGLIKVAGYGLLTLIRFLSITGGIYGHVGKDPICKILWVKETQPKIYNETYKFLDCKDYLVYKCTGNFVISRDYANIWWMMDTRKGRFNWSDTILKKYGIDKAKLPEIRKATDVAGKLAPEAAAGMELLEGIPVIVGAGDVASAAVGSGAVREGKIHAYVGTSGWLGCHLSERKKDLFHYIGSICSANPDTYLCVAEQETAGACLDWLKDTMFKESLEADVYKLFSEMAAKVKPGADGLIFTPWLFGERAPLDDPTVRGGFHNLSLEHTREHMVRAVFEGVALNIKWALFYMEKLAGKAESINIIGGGAISDVWCQIFADALNKKINRVSDPKEAGAKGAAIIATIALGHIKSFEDSEKLVKIDAVYEPNPQNAAVYERIFKEFQNIYKNNKQMYRRLNLKAE